MILSAALLRVKSRQMPGRLKLPFACLTKGTPCRLSHVIVKKSPGGLDDTQLRNLETRLGYLRELEDRRQAILKSISEQGKLTDELAGAINATLSKTELEDLYLPYKPKRRTRGQIAIEAGLSRWPICSGTSRPTILTWKRQSTLMATKAWRTRKPRSTAHATF
ncbi:transcription accessory protein [Salmonella enterica subsp. enterica]|uniref:Transcription accessory protein n=1 Tax=Salmonella enterica I TaxID=59201 RepID=A0A3S4FGL8_SALET|nr:transcription accessory protein [Salmonella enterica subsp. enterica]